MNTVGKIRRWDNQTNQAAIIRVHNLTSAPLNFGDKESVSFFYQWWIYSSSSSLEIFFVARCSVSLDLLTHCALQSHLSGKWTNAKLRMNRCQEVLFHQDCLNCSILHSTAEWLKTHCLWTCTRLLRMIFLMVSGWFRQLLSLLLVFLCAIYQLMKLIT